eukprot:tig00020851_g14712.t1
MSETHSEAARGPPGTPQKEKEGAENREREKDKADKAAAAGVKQRDAAAGTVHVRESTAKTFSFLQRVAECKKGGTGGPPERPSTRVLLKGVTSNAVKQGAMETAAHIVLNGDFVAHQNLRALALEFGGKASSAALSKTQRGMAEGALCAAVSRVNVLQGLHRLPLLDAGLCLYHGAAALAMLDDREEAVLVASESLAEALLDFGSSSLVQTAAHAHACPNLCLLATCAISGALKKYCLREDAALHCAFKRWLHSGAHGCTQVLGTSATEGQTAAA